MWATPDDTTRGKDSVVIEVTRRREECAALERNRSAGQEPECRMCVAKAITAAKRRRGAPAMADGGGEESFHGEGRHEQEKKRDGAKLTLENDKGKKKKKKSNDGK